MFYLNSILYFIGLITFIIWLYKAFNFINIYFLQSSKFNRCEQNRPNGANPWALVTEVTSTVGLTFAHEIASRGFNVVLQGSNKDGLELVKSDYEKLHPICSFMTLVADSSTVEGVDFEAIHNQLEPLNLTVLINNAGRRLEEIPFGLLTSFSHTRTAQDISANITFLLLLIKTVLPILGRNNPLSHHHGSNHPRQTTAASSHVPREHVISQKHVRFLGSGDEAWKPRRGVDKCESGYHC
ncbi:unnamed protein product [Fusarium equiseti]|uniref:Uncharacterized protein n=1 Tax=Fusarium equiseti TaxID=61235 RepID=A0A8J2IN40_FUSEQ|nr:unnamed protein product [Fusarium equiseti]